MALVRTRAKPDLRRRLYDRTAASVRASDLPLIAAMLLGALLWFGAMIWFGALP